MYCAWTERKRVCLSVGSLLFHQPACVFRDGSAHTIVCAATLREKLQIKLAISAGHRILTPDNQS